MRRVWTLAAVAVAVTAGTLFFTGGSGESPARVPVRPAFPLPDPTADAKAKYFLDLIRSGEITDLGNERPATWRVIGFPAFSEQGKAAVDLLLDLERLTDYTYDPARLVSVLQLIAQTPEVLHDDRLIPFLLHWLDPENRPPSKAGAVWAGEYRKMIFPILTHVPDLRAVPYCVDELTAGEGRTLDLRTAAIVILFQVGRIEPILKAFRSLPPNDKNPNGAARYFVLEKLLELALLDKSDARREYVGEFEPLLRGGLDSEHGVERVLAARILLIRGDESMRDTLVAEYEAQRENDLPQAWYALEALGGTRADPFVRKVCLDTVRNPGDERDLAFYTSLSLLSHNWMDDPEVRELLWNVFETDPLGLYKQDTLVKRLLALDRPRVLKAVGDAYRSDDPELRRAALTLVRRLRIPEAAPWLLERARRIQDARERLTILGTCVLLRAPAAEPVCAALLDDPSTANRNAGASLLLDLSARRGIERIEQRLRDGDDAVLDAVLQRGLRAGEAAIPTELTPALIEQVKHAPGENGRLKALYVLRIQADLALCKDGLMEAYRFEESRRVADEIRKVLIELAHR